MATDQANQTAPQWVETWAPGRVNLIGEHTDYAGLPVLPIAVDLGVTVRAEPSSRYSARSMQFGEAETIDPDDTEPRGWGRYLWAVLSVMGGGIGPTRFEVESDLPSEAGLSSSSALVLGVLGALDSLWELEMSEGMLIDLASVAEKAVGIEGGTMDQTVIAMARPQTATRVDFVPRRIEHIPLPEGIAVVAAHCGTASPKTGRVRDAYDALVLGSRCAATLLASELGMERETAYLLGELSVEEDLTLHLPERGTPLEVAGMTGCPIDQLIEFSSRSLDPTQPIAIRDVAHHQVTEARRVDEATKSLKEADIERLGDLLDRSHRSLQRLGVSSAALDETVGKLRAVGAIGARLTGAGFGGFCVAVMPADLASDAAASLDDAFVVVASGGMRR